MSAVVAIVGRPNVGKSTLFNRLVGKRSAIESNIPGTTRDRLYQNVRIHNHDVLLVDTGGLELDKDGDDIESNVQEQSRVAIDGADVIVFVVDVREDLTSEDFNAAELLRKSRKPVILVANKCDNPKLCENRFNLYELGFGEPIAITALHSYGIDELESKIVKQLLEDGIEETEEKLDDDDGRVKIAFLGRPNVGKSTMVNGLFGKKMVVVSDVPGTTRDSSRIPFEYDGTDYTLIDTAGVRRRGKVEKGIERYSVLRSMQAVSDADICVLMLDFEEGITSQDCHVSSYILSEKKGLIIVVNKIDLVDGDVRDTLENTFIVKLQNKMAYAPWAPVIFTSAKDRKNIFKILELSRDIYAERKKELDQGELSVWLDMVLAKHPPKGSKGKRRFNVIGVEQKETEPPGFVFYCEWPEIMHFSYGRFLENELRKQFGFVGSALRMSFKRLKKR